MLATGLEQAYLLGLPRDSDRTSAWRARAIRWCHLPRAWRNVGRAARWSPTDERCSWTGSNKIMSTKTPGTQLSIIAMVAKGEGCELWPARCPRRWAVFVVDPVLLWFHLEGREDTNTFLQTDRNLDPGQSTYRPFCCTQKVKSQVLLGHFISWRREVGLITHPTPDLKSSIRWSLSSWSSTQ